jgi:uncharacterized membrane protein YtjA (UPF0391 family)
MLRWAAFFLVLLIASSVLAFTTVFSVAVGIAKVFFFIFLALFVITLVAGLFFANKLKRKK